MKFFLVPKLFALNLSKKTIQRKKIQSDWQEIVEIKHIMNIIIWLIKVLYEYIFITPMKAICYFWMSEKSLLIVEKNEVH